MSAAHEEIEALRAEAVATSEVLRGALAIHRRCSTERANMAEEYNRTWARMEEWRRVSHSEQAARTYASVVCVHCGEVDPTDILSGVTPAGDAPDLETLDAALTQAREACEAAQEARDDAELAYAQARKALRVAEGEP